jgi:hypothetical protein
VTATTTTSIQGVSVFSTQKKRGAADVFELGLSPAGIEVRRPGRPVQQLPWDRVSEWEIEERKGHVLLTLRGRGATTPLVVPGWRLEDLELLMREVTLHATTYVPEGPGPIVTDGNGVTPSGAPAPAAAVAAPATPAAAPAPPTPRAPVAGAAATAAAAAVTSTPSVPKPAPASPTPTRGERRQQTTRARRTPRPRQVSWRAVVTVVLLGTLVTAVTLVLLQSAGVINWGFLGPVA